MTNRTALSPNAMAVLDQAKNLSPDERIEIAARLWHDLVDLDDAAPIPAWHWKILEARLAEPDDNAHTTSGQEAYDRLETAIRRARGE